jgi:3-oxoacyl-[acyl-carrier protein] reductase
LAGQAAIVVGGAGGIGLAIARELDARGCRVVVASRDRERVAQAVGALGKGVGFADCDVRDATRVAALFDFASERLGAVDITVNSAGVGRGTAARRLPDPVSSLAEMEWDEVIDTNLRGAFLVCREAARRMAPRKRGPILNISSARGARRGQAFAAGYSASKMAVLAMFQSFAAEVAPLGIRAMSLLPDAVDTSLIDPSRLAPRGAMAPAHVARLAVDMLSLPLDALLDEPLLAPLGARRGPQTDRSEPTSGAA